VNKFTNGALQIFSSIHRTIEELKKIEYDIIKGEL
jgi:hypothetical protein